MSFVWLFVCIFNTKTTTDAYQFQEEKRPANRSAGEMLFSLLLLTVVVSAFFFFSFSFFVTVSKNFESKEKIGCYLGPVLCDCSTIYDDAERMHASL